MFCSTLREQLVEDFLPEDRHSLSDVVKRVGIQHSAVRLQYLLLELCLGYAVRRQKSRPLMDPNAPYAEFLSYGTRVLWSILEFKGI